MTSCYWPFTEDVSSGLYLWSRQVSVRVLWSLQARCGCYGNGTVLMTNYVNGWNKRSKGCLCGRFCWWFEDTQFLFLWEQRPRWRMMTASHWSSFPGLSCSSAWPESVPAGRRWMEASMPLMGMTFGKAVLSASLSPSCCLPRGWSHGWRGRSSGNCLGPCREMWCGDYLSQKIQRT